MKVVYKWEDKNGREFECDKHSHIGGLITETLDIIDKLDDKLVDVECQVPDLLGLLDEQATVWMVA